MKNIEALKDLLSKSKNIAIIAHVNPDGDAVGSAIALTQFLNEQGHNATAILPNNFPTNLSKVKKSEEILIFTSKPDIVTEKIATADVIFCLDFNDISTRIEKLGEIVLSNKKCKKVLIDHHQAPPKEQYDILFSNTEKSSTALMVFNLIDNLGHKDDISKISAEAIFVGMMTDTGNFTYGNLDEEVFYTLGFLTSKGVLPNMLHSRIFNNQSASRLKLIGYALSQKMEVLPEIKSSYITLTAKELEDFNYVEGDIEGLVNIPLSIEGIENSAIFVEKPNLTKISLRSLTDGIDVNKFIREHYIGGGHIHAAGGKMAGPLKKAVDAYIEGMEKIYIV